MEQTNEPTTKNERQPRAISAAWRHNEDGTYNHKPTSESYFRDYYRRKASHHINCSFCNKSVVVHDIKRHQRSKRCLLIQSSLTSDASLTGIDKNKDFTDSSTSSGSENC